MARPPPAQCSVTLWVHALDAANPLSLFQTRMQSLRSAHNSSITETFRYMVQREGLLR